MEPDAQPESDSAASWRAGMSPSSSLLLALHVRGGVTEVAMQSTGQYQWGGAGGTQRLSRARSRVPMWVRQDGLKVGCMGCPSHVSSPKCGEVEVCGKRNARGGVDT